jgi:hypothetical protein
MRLAIFKEIAHDFSMVRPESDEPYTDMVRMTHYAEVEFVPRPPEEFVPAQVESLDKQIAAVSQEFGKKLAELQTRKADLLALTDQRSTPSESPQ